MSMLALGELLDADSSIKNIFYVFPFTTLITQTYESLKETLGLEDEDIAEIHSKAPENVRMKKMRMKISILIIWIRCLWTIP